MSVSKQNVPFSVAEGDFISFSANGEDVILRRLFKEQLCGFYVDIGAAHPTFENDTRSFYNHGWSGINIEPNPTFFLELAQERPRDRNLQLAVSNEAGTLEYWQVVGTGLSTCDAEEALRAREKGFEVRQLTVTCATLTEIFDDAQVSAIDFLKVDVEGLELRVLQGNDWTRYRPSVIIVEATYPETPIRRPDRIRPFLEQNGYDFAYFDGLNDYFLDRSFIAPEEAFRPISVFDRVTPFPVASLRKHASNLEEARRVQDDYVSSLLARVAQLEQESEAQLEHERGALGALQAHSIALEAARSCLEVENSAMRHRNAVMRREALSSQIRAGREQDEAAQAHQAASLAGERLLGVTRELDRAAAELHNASIAVEQAREKSKEDKLMLAATYISTSWRITRPLRGLARVLGRK